MTTRKQDDSDKLPQLMCALPQEIYDKIYNLSFTIDIAHSEDDESAQIVRIDNVYRPPAIMQVDRTTRRAVAADFYPNMHFHGTNAALLVRWLCSIPYTHLELLKYVEHGITEPYTSKSPVDDAEYDELRFKAAEVRMNLIHVELDRQGVDVFPHGFLRARVWETIDGVVYKGPPCRAMQVMGMRAYFAWCKVTSIFTLARERLTMLNRG